VPLPPGTYRAEIQTVPPRTLQEVVAAPGQPVELPLSAPPSPRARRSGSCLDAAGREGAEASGSCRGADLERPDAPHGAGNAE